MIQIKARGAVIDGYRFDYELEDGALLHCIEWNGKTYITHANGGKRVYYYPIYSHEKNASGSHDILGFEKGELPELPHGRQRQAHDEVP